MDPSISSVSSDLSVLSHTPRCLSLSHHRHHPYYPLEEYMDSDTDPDTDLNVADMRHSGTLSLHHYRKTLGSETDSCVVLGVHGRKKLLRRKNGASNLQTPSVSATSSPPPLSPSYSMTMSVTSQPSEVDQDGFGFLSGASSPQNTSEYAIPWRISNRLNTFRDRLRKPSSSIPPHQPCSPGPSHSKARSDSMLLDVRRPKATMVHHGTSFEILNPHESLNFARIVSYIEDVDYSPRSSSEHQRESLSFLSESTDGSETVGAIMETATVSSSRSASPAATVEEDGCQRTHSDLVGDAAHVPLPSISERLATSPVEPSRISLDAPDRSDILASGPSDIGEPGPIFEDGSSSSSSTKQERDGTTACPSSYYPLGNRSVQPTPETEIRARPESRLKKRPFTRLRGIVRGLAFLRRRQN